jgi:hypothetical protein
LRQQACAQGYCRSDRQGPHINTLIRQRTL